MCLEQMCKGKNDQYVLGLATCGSKYQGGGRRGKEKEGNCKRGLETRERDFIRV